jgi:hypothetical protein
LNELTGLNASASSLGPRVPAVRPSELLNSRASRFHAFYCLPGLEGAHEKGGVEGEVGYFRRNYLVPVPEVASLDELNAQIAEAERAEDRRRIGARIRTIGQDF